MDKSDCKTHSRGLEPSTVRQISETSELRTHALIHLTIDSAYTLEGQAAIAYTSRVLLRVDTKNARRQFRRLSGSSWHGPELQHGALSVRNLHTRGASRAPSMINCPELPVCVPDYPECADG